MSTSKQTQGNTALSRLSKPKLTIDTHALAKLGPDLCPTQSAPVGSRLERGIPPMYQAVDRHCAKVAEMMNSPTWRSRRPGPGDFDDSTPCEPLELHDAYAPKTLSPSVENGGDPRSIRDIRASNESLAEIMRQRTQSRRHAASDIFLGRDGEAMSIVGIHPFLEFPDSPTNTFILSAALPHGASCRQDTFIGELQPVMAPGERSDVQSKTDEDDLSFEQAHEDGSWKYETGSQSSPRSLTQSPDDSQSMEAHHEQDTVGSEERKRNKERDIHQLMERDEAIKSVNSQHSSLRRHGRPDPEDRQRFQGLLGRLRCEIHALDDDSTDRPNLNDPTTVSFAPKEGSQHSTNNELSAQPHAAERNYLGKKDRHADSDSGYVSHATYSRPSTRAQSRSRRGTSDDVGSEPTAFQRGIFDKKDSRLDSTSNHSTLNPTAKEFSSVNDHNLSLGKRFEVPPLPVPDHAFFPLQQAQGQFGANSQSPGLGFTALSNFGSPLANLVLTQPGLPQLFSATLPQASPFAQAIMPTPPGFGLTANLPPAVQSPGITSGLPLLSPPSTMGIPGLANSPGLVPPAVPISSEFTGAFHHQLPNFSSCNNPAHHTLGAFSSTQGFQAPVMPQLAPPVPPASMLSPGQSASVPPPITPAVPAVNPIFGKNVPKPKVPNTTGQQYWEYWHELRRTFEPGYAQKSKQNQQKRYMKQQVYKNGAATDQS